MPSLRVVLQQKKQQEQQERLRLLLQIQKVAALDMALGECQAENLMPLAASLLVEALSLPLVAHGGKVRLPGVQSREGDTGGDKEPEGASPQDGKDANDAGVIRCMQEAKEKVSDALKTTKNRASS